MKPIMTTVISNKKVMPGVSLLWIKSPQIATTAKPGQFVMVDCGENTLLRRPFSIHQIDENRTSAALLFSTVGKGTQWLSQRNIDDRIDLLGPLGNGFTINSSSCNLLLVGGGIGVAPLPFLARVAMERNCSVTMLLGAATVTQLYPNYLLPSTIKCNITTDDGTTSNKGFVTDLIPKYINRADQIFACGPSLMYRSMVKILEMKSRLVQISLEARMGCGFGLCYGCTVKTRVGLKQICQDGPVFELNNILWDEYMDL